MKYIIVTDPCYLISSGDWSKLCEKCDGVEDGKWSEKFNEYVKGFLKEVSGDEQVKVADTGYGDWANSIGGMSFCADSGTVCVLEMTDKFKDYIKKNDFSLSPSLAAIVPVSDDARYAIDCENPFWSVVHIYDRGRVISSEEKSNEYEIEEE